MGTIHTQLRKAGRTLATASDKREQAMAEITRLVQDDTTLAVTEIANLTGLTRQTIYNLRKKA